MDIYAGARIHQSSSKTCFIEQNGPTYVLDEGMDVPVAMVPLFDHAQEAFRKCKDVDLAMTNLEKQCSGGGTYFPVVTGKKPKSRRPPRTSKRRPVSASKESDESPGKELPSLSASLSASAIDFPEVIGIKKFVCPSWIDISPSLLCPQMPSYQATPADSFIQGSMVGSGKENTRESSRIRSGGHSVKSGGHSVSACSRPSSGRSSSLSSKDKQGVVRSVDVGDICKALQVGPSVTSTYFMLCMWCIILQLSCFYTLPMFLSILRSLNLGRCGYSTRMDPNLSCSLLAITRHSNIPILVGNSSCESISHAKD